MQQNTQEWKDFRKNKIGASDAPVIMGISPWKTAMELWEEKLGLRESQQTNEWLLRGHQLEPIAREAYCRHTGIDVVPTVVVHPEETWMMASLDGLSKDSSSVVEIKCPGQKDHALAKDGTVPGKYYPQLQHQLAVTGLEMVHYFSFAEDNFILIEVQRDCSYIEKMMKEEKSFWKKIQNFESPPLTNRDFAQRSDSEWLSVADEWKSLQENLASLKKQEKNLREQLISLTSGQSSRGGGVSVRKVVRKGNIDYTSIPSISGKDLEQYRKPPIESWRFS